MCLTGMHPKMHLRVLEEHAPKGATYKTGSNRHSRSRGNMPDAKSVSGICDPKESVALFGHKFAYGEFLA
jgi:hypothetical protein